MPSSRVAALLSTARVRSGVLTLALLAPVALPAQVVRGTVRTRDTSLPLERAQVTARDVQGVLLGSAISDSSGFWQFRMRPDVGFILEVKRLGFSQGATEVPPMATGDTAQIEFLMAEVAAMAEAVTIVAEPGVNDRRLAEAERRGWKVYPPELIMQHRAKSQDFFQLLRSVGGPGLILPRSLNDCVRSTRSNRCLTYIVDGQILGPTANILPTDIYFLAVLSASQSSVQFGDRAPWGALYVVTRSALDRVQPPRAQRRPPPAGSGATPAARPPR
jgi:hypothetical protein